MDGSLASKRMSAYRKRMERCTKAWDLYGSALQRSAPLHTRVIDGCALRCSSATTQLARRTCRATTKTNRGEIMTTTPKWYVPVAILALLWNLFGCWAY